MVLGSSVVLALVAVADDCPLAVTLGKLLATLFDAVSAAVVEPFAADSVAADSVATDSVAADCVAADCVLTALSVGVAAIVEATVLPVALDEVASVALADCWEAAALDESARRGGPSCRL